MFLRSLSIKGFKSFADATTLVMEPGVTVVVGPNGSGKSNVVDAIGWVLGAQAPSAVRSQKMDDVIFAGTQKRPALGRAEVSLTIDNSSGLLPIEFNEVTITRTLFRTGDSEYSINGVPCRLLDIQELLSDSGVGRQQHVIISQGQIDAVLNARAEDRRLIIEEAAGVLKFRRRKEKAERRLSATEGNLTRLQDLLREVRRQLRPLEKQADAARRHGDVVAELTALRIHLAGLELTRLRSRLQQGQTTRAALAAEERDVRAALRRLDAEVLATEARLTAMGGDDLGDALVRFESLREKARGQVAVLTERRRGIERDRGAFVDQAVVANLESEAARLAQELADVDALVAELAPALHELERLEADLAIAQQDFQGEWAEGVATPTGAAAEVRGELAAVRAAVGRSDSEVARARARLDRLDQRLARLAGEGERTAAERAEAEGAVERLAAEVASAEAARRAAEAELDEATEAARQAEAERHTWSARADALALALDQARARAGAERLAGVAGVVGTLLDVVEVDAGWEPAFEAAAGEAIAAVVVESVDAGRAALAELRSGDLSGAVLALGAGRSVAAAVPATEGCGATSAAAPASTPCSTLSWAPPWWPRAGPTPSTWPSPTPTPWWSPAPAIASGPPAGAWAPPARAPPVPRWRRPGAGRRRPRRPPRPPPPASAPPAPPPRRLARPRSPPPRRSIATRRACPRRPMPPPATSGTTATPPTSEPRSRRASWSSRIGLDATPTARPSSRLACPRWRPRRPTWPSRGGPWPRPGPASRTGRGRPPRLATSTRCARRAWPSGARRCASASSRSTSASRATPSSARRPRLAGWSSIVGRWPPTPSPPTWGSGSSCSTPRWGVCASCAASSPRPPGR
ncbi:MAG: AAA family ATPase [Acidimicrobiales bacterium]